MLRLTPWSVATVTEWSQPLRAKRPTTKSTGGPASQFPCESEPYACFPSILAALQKGLRIHCDSDVLSWEESSGRFVPFTYWWYTPCMPYMLTLTPLAPPQCRHIWQSHGVSGYWWYTLVDSLIPNIFGELWRPTGESVDSPSKNIAA